MVTQKSGGDPREVSISLVICTRNRAEPLRRCLDNLTRLRCDQQWELVLVDNGSTDNTQEVIGPFQKTVPCRFTRVYEAAPGLGRARNAGWRAASGEFLSFTDDDCYPQADFLDAVLRGFEGKPSVGFVGGRILLHDPTDYPITIQEQDRQEFLPARTFIPAGLIQGANMSFRRAAIEAVNGFDEWFGAGALFACEDVDLVARISAAGWDGAYDPGPLVYHHHGRKTKADAARLMKQYDRGRGAYYAKGLLNPAVRSTTLKHWTWNIPSQPPARTTREFAAALEYWARLILSVTRRGSKRVQDANGSAFWPIPGSRG